MEEAQRSAQLGSWRFHPETEQLEWSLEFRRIAGFDADTPAEVERFLERVHPDDRVRFREGYEQIVLQPDKGDIDGRLVRPDGQIRHVRLRGHVVRNASGRLELRGTMQDVTDQVRLREELAHAQKMEAVGRLAGGIAHDFNNLLTVIIGNLELLKDRVGQAPEVEESLQALDSAANLTRRLLAFGRKAQLSLMVIDPPELVRSTTSLMRRLVGDQITLETEFAPDLPKVYVDPVEIERALVNLVVNARNVMPNGGVVKIAVATRHDGDTQLVDISVADQGPGISEAELPHIFEPFYTTRGHAGGVGLGLATVLGTAEQHGGTVRVSSKAGDGAVFTLVIPSADQKLQRHEIRQITAPYEGKQKALQILVIDDEPMISGVVQRMLAALGHTVLVANDSKEAEELWLDKGQMMDLVICDVVMPDVRGPELIRKLSRDGPAPLVLFMSGYNEEAALAPLEHPILPKPFSVTDLTKAIRQLTSSGAAAALGRR
jgi:PAS domain S-box-containing protein